MKGKRLQARFVLAGCLLVAATVGSSLWIALTFVRLNTSVDNTLRESQETIDLSAELHSSLEREDDALLLFLSGNIDQARRDLEAERRRGDLGFERLMRLVGEGDEQALAVQLRQHIARYRAAGDDLLAHGDRNGGLEAYHRKVNPLLRQAVAGCDQLREANFRSMQQTGVRARDEAARGTRLVVVISVLTVALGIGVAVWLARSVLGPVQELTASVEGIRKGDFDRRVRHISADELGQLGAGFNRMAEALAEYRRSSLGELLTAKNDFRSHAQRPPRRRAGVRAGRRVDGGQPAGSERAGGQAGQLGRPTGGDPVFRRPARGRGRRPRGSFAGGPPSRLCPHVQRRSRRSASAVSRDGRAHPRVRPGTLRSGRRPRRRDGVCSLGRAAERANRGRLA